jgi:hypothetical protein
VPGPCHLTCRSPLAGRRTAPAPTSWMTHSRRPRPRPEPRKIAPRSPLKCTSQNLGCVKAGRTTPRESFSTGSNQSADKRFSGSPGSLTIPGGESLRICSIDPSLSFPCRISLLAFPQPMSACHPFSLHAGIAGNTGYRNPRLPAVPSGSAPLPRLRPRPCAAISRICNPLGRIQIRSPGWWDRIVKDLSHLRIPKSNATRI